MKARQPAVRRTSRCGTTLVEVIVSCLILTIIAVATAECMYHSRAESVKQRNRRLALDAANSRLEDTRAALYTNIKPPANDYSVYFLSKTGATWTVSSTDPGETVLIAGHAREMDTTVQYVDADGGVASYDCLRVAVVVNFSGNASTVVKLETIRAP